MHSLQEYQQEVRDMAFYPDNGTGTPLAVSYAALGLTGEAGEVAEKVKKWLRDGTFDRMAVLKELGDVTWYIAAMCIELELDMQEVIEVNLQKLRDRTARGVRGGSGDDR